MEIRLEKIRPLGAPNDLQLPPQGVVSWWLEQVLAARLALNLPSSEVDPLDNLINNFLSSVLVLGMQPPVEAIRRVERSSIEVSTFLLEPMTPRVRRYRCRLHGSVALLVHGLHALGDSDEWAYRRVAGIGYDCFMFAANTFRPIEYNAQIYTDLAMNFERYSELLTQAVEQANQPPTA